MEEDKKLLGEKRRESIIKWLKESVTPIIGEELSKKANVSRQVIVQDISLLKARNEPIVATSQGYIYLQNQAKSELFSRIIPCLHQPKDALAELQLLVDHGVVVKDVIVEHQVYGEISASLMISNRHEVNRFIDQIHTKKASYLSELTKGVHLHTIEADTIEKLDAACEALDKANFLLKDK